MWCESSSANHVNLMKKLAQFQRCRIFPRRLFLLAPRVKCNHKINVITLFLD